MPQLSRVKWKRWRRPGIELKRSADWLWNGWLQRARELQFIDSGSWFFSLKETFELTMSLQDDLHHHELFNKWVLFSFFCAEMIWSGLLFSGGWWSMIRFFLLRDLDFDKPFFRSFSLVIIRANQSGNYGLNGWSVRNIYRVVIWPLMVSSPHSSAALG